MCTLVIAIAVALYSFYVVIAGKMRVSSNREVRGTPARLIGLIGLLPIPLVLFCVFGIDLVFAVLGEDLDREPRRKWAVGVEMVGLAVCVVVMLVLGSCLAQPLEGKSNRSARRSRDDDDYDEEERPRRRSRRADDFDDDDDRPRRGRWRDDDDDRPRRGRWRDD